MYRQGDVLIKKVESIQGKKLNHLILAEGEVTGHKHKIEGDAELYQNEDGIIFLRIFSETATLVHQEHNPIILPRGDFEIKIQREYEPNGWRKVSD